MMVLILRCRYVFQKDSIVPSCFRSRSILGHKAEYTATPVACGWAWQGLYLRSLHHLAGAVKPKTAKKVKCDGFTDRRTEGWTDKAGCSVAQHTTKKQKSNMFNPKHDLKVGISSKVKHPSPSGQHFHCHMHSSLNSLQGLKTEKIFHICPNCPQLLRKSFLKVFLISLYHFHWTLQRDVQITRKQNFVLISMQGILSKQISCSNNQCGALVFSRVLRYSSPRFVHPSVSRLVPILLFQRFELTAPAQMLQ